MRYFPLDNFRRLGALGRFFLIMALGVALDLWTKHLAFQKLAITGPNGKLNDTYVYRLVEGYLQLSVTINHGAVFGMGEGKLVLFIAVSIAAIFFLIYLFANSGRQAFYQIILGMLLAGVLGNMYDRLTYGYVRDMIHALPRWPHLFPWIFNIADVLLCVGVGLMVLYSFFTGHGHFHNGQPADQSLPAPQQHPPR